MNRPRIGFTSTPLIFSLPSTTFPVCTAPKWSESIASASSQSAESANWCLCCPGSCTTQIDCLLTGALLSTGLPTFQASRPPAFLPPAPGLLPTTCTPSPPPLCRANWIRRFKLWIFFTCFTREKMAQFSRAQSKRGGVSKLASWLCRRPSVYLPFLLLTPL